MSPALLLALDVGEILLGHQDETVLLLAKLGPALLLLLDLRVDPLVDQPKPKACLTPGLLEAKLAVPAERPPGWVRAAGVPSNQHECDLTTAHHARHESGNDRVRVRVVRLAVSRRLERFQVAICERLAWHEIRLSPGATDGPLTGFRGASWETFGNVMATISVRLPVAKRCAMICYDRLPAKENRCNSHGMR